MTALRRSGAALARRGRRGAEWVPWCLALGVAALAPAGVAKAQGEFRDTADVVVVEVPVQVLEDGEPVRGLTADDFEVRDGGEKREIVAFDVIDLAEVPRDPAAWLGVDGIPVSARRHFLFLFDLSFSEPDSVLRARQAARNLLRTALHPSDLVALATYRSSTGVDLVLGFTSDRAQAEAAIDTLGVTEPLSPVVDPLGFMVAEAQAEALDVVEGQSGAVDEDGPGSGGAERRIFEAQEDLLNRRDLQALGERASRDRQQSRILSLTGSLTELAQALAVVDGRIDLVLLSEGFDTSVALGIQGESDEGRQRIGELSDAVGTGELWRVDSETRFGSGAALSGVDEVIDAMRRSGVTIQAVDVGGIRAGPGTGRAAGEDGLFLFADQTGGQLYRNFNELGEAMGRMLHRSSVVYVLAFQADSVEADGRFREIEVRLKGRRRGLELLHRPGYYPPKPVLQQTAVERQLSTADLLMGPVGGSLAPNVLATPLAPLGDGLVYVPVVVEADGYALLAASRTPELEIETYAYALDAAGTVRDFLAHTSAIDAIATRDRLLQGGVKLYGGLSLPAGDYTLRLMVREAYSGASGVVATTLSVPDLTVPGAAVPLPPLLPAVAEQWVVSELETPEVESGRAPRQPFRWGSREFLPSALPYLPSPFRVQVCLRAYSVAGDDAVGLSLRPRDGGEAVGLRFGVDEGFSLVGSDGRCVPARMEVPAMAAGRYDLVFTVRRPSGEEISASTPVTIVGG